MSLKENDNGLTRVWKPKRSHKPFYAGGKTEFVRTTHENANMLVCLHDDNIKFINWKNGECSTSLLPEEEENKEEITSFCVHPSGLEVVVATQTRLLKHWRLSEDYSSKECVRTIRGHLMPVLTMAYDATGTLVATGSADRTVRVWDIERGYCTHNFKEHTEIVQHLKFHPDPNRLSLLSCSEDCTIRVYNLEGEFLTEDVTK